MGYHLIAFIAGFILDLILGDPYWLPHPVRRIGSCISFFEKRLRRPDGRHQKWAGVAEVLLVTLSTVLVTAVLLYVTYAIHPVFGCTVEAVMTYQILATKCLKTESMKVYRKLEKGTLDEARTAVSMIVGRDTENLSDEEVTKAAVETVAENTSDGSIAPMLFLALGGPVAGFLYKAVNTMDSMIGYKDDTYRDFGWCAAKTDDVLNYLPSRISALLMITSCLFLGRAYSVRHAIRIWRRDRRKHESPNSAQTESTCAGALGIRLAGPAAYHGVIEDKPYLGDSLRPIEHKDIIRANRLLYTTAFLCEALCALIIYATGWMY